MTSASEFISRKRDGEELEESEIEALIGGYLGGHFPDYQMSAFLMAVLFRGMTIPETESLTRVMLNSGHRLQWNDRRIPVVDKHSIGGVGDKISLILAPLLAAYGLRVPMISGRGLASTGGTLDKLESIPGFRTDLTLEEIVHQVETIGCVITGAGPEIAPADARLYSLRDVTGTVPSIPLITSSILSKKMAESPDALILDVKFGHGAFMRDLDSAIELGQCLVKVSRQMGVPARALLTDMDQPLGTACGNASEVREACEVLAGKGPSRVRQLTLRLGAELVNLVQPGVSVDEARKCLARLLDDGSAAERFEKFVERQSGQIGEFQDEDSGLICLPVPAPESGTIEFIRAAEIGYTINQLGGGRQVIGEAIDHQVGVEVHVEIGDAIVKGSALATVRARNPTEAHLAQARLRDAVGISSGPVECRPLIVGLISESGCWRPE